MPTESAAEVQEYGQFVCAAILEIGEPVKEMPLEAIPAWMDTSKVPERVLEKVAELRVVLKGNRRWSELNALQRFALFKLTCGGHENNNFLPALREFGLAG